MRYYAHILNLIVWDGLKDLNESIIKFRNVVRYVKSSSNRFEKFKACVEKEKNLKQKFVVPWYVY